MFVCCLCWWLGLGPVHAEDAEPGMVIPVAEARRVVAAVVRAAEGAPAARGDDLADLCVRRAAAAAAEEGISPRGFLLGLGVALDSTDQLRNNPLTRPLVTRVESDQERRRRLQSLGKPTLRGRHDWLLHFAASAALAAHLGPEAAEGAGLAKELLDARGGSGFSFADLAADFAGVSLARRLLSADEPNRISLRELARRFRGADFFPRVDDLEEGLSWRRFTEKYGGPSDPRFVRQAEEIRHRLRRRRGAAAPGVSSRDLVARPPTGRPPIARGTPWQPTTGYRRRGAASSRARPLPPAR
jgi:hypothetical protein